MKKAPERRVRRGLRFGAVKGIEYVSIDLIEAGFLSSQSQFVPRFVPLFPNGDLCGAQYSRDR